MTGDVQDNVCITLKQRSVQPCTCSRQLVCSVQVVYLLPAAIPVEYQHFWGYLDEWACREDGWHKTPIALVVIIFDF